MSWVFIDEGKCNQCGLCVTRCPSCYSEDDGSITAKANEMTCICCGHCVSLCPTDAIRHRKMDMDNFPPIDKDVHIDTSEFIRFLRQRRSHRHFKDRAIPQATLETLIDICRYAPTGGNRQAVELKIIQDPDKIKLLSDLTVDHFVSMIQRVKGQIEKLNAEGEEVPKDLELLRSNMLRYESMALGREAGMDVVFRKAPCVIVFHASPRRALTPKDDCVIAAQTLSMLARTMKLETCYIGLFVTASTAHPRIIEKLKLPSQNRVYSVLILGYPRLKYLRAVDRRSIEVTWE